MQIGNAQNVTEPDFRKKFISGRKCRKYARKTGFFGIFSRFHHCLFFLIFSIKMFISNAQNMVESDFWEKFFSDGKCRNYSGNRRFCIFSLNCFLLFRCFSHKNIINNNVHHKAWFICQKTDFCSRNFLKVAGTADFRRKNGKIRLFLYIACFFSLKI